jgi:NDP-sugar pyrophosphorylase family protein
MEEYKVLITTSGIGSRLGNLTLFTNKCLVRVGKKPAISYIVEKYPDNIEIVVTLGHYGDQVRDFLELVYPKKKFTFVEVDKFDGEGSSLGYSLLKAKERLQCPFIFHASDTIVFENIPDPNANWVAYSLTENSSEFRTIELNSKLKIYEKGEIFSNAAYIGLSGINDYISFWESLESEYKSNNTKNLSDCHAINRIITQDWKSLEFKTWLDIGNVSSLRKSRSIIEDKFHILDKNDESIFIFDDFVIKFFYDKKVCQNRIKRTEHLKNLVPNIIGYKSNFFKYEYAKGETLSSVINENIFKSLLEWSIKNLWINEKESDEFLIKCNDFYFTKTIERINKFFKQNNTEDTENIINGFKVPCIMDLIKDIDKNDLLTNKSYGFHGDYIIDNIIFDGDKFKLIDWRQDFGGDLENGDIYYDLSKLNHNLLFNHDIVNSGHYTIEIKNNEVKCDILRSDNLSNCREILHEFILKNNFDLKKVKILTSLIWINMAPLHEPKIGNFLFYFGKLNLYKTIYNK